MKVKLAACLLAVSLALPLSGCSEQEPVKLVLTTGFRHNEIFRLEDASCTLPELMVYLTTEQNTYEGVYGPRIWEVKEGEEGLSDKLKNKVLAEISQIKAMTLLADRRGIQLTPQEEEMVAAAAEEYYASLNDREREAMEVNRQLIESMYRDYALADKVYRQIISDINPEISDDEARTITVQHILIKTVTENADGTISPYSDKEKTKCYTLEREEDHREFAHIHFAQRRFFGYLQPLKQLLVRPNLKETPHHAHVQCLSKATRPGEQIHLAPVIQQITNQPRFIYIIKIFLADFCKIFYPYRQFLSLHRSSPPFFGGLSRF